MARVILIGVLVCVCALPAGAQEPASSQPLIAESGGGAGEALAPVPALAPPATKRPAALVPLYVSYATLQVIDVATTRAALKGETGREGNPMMQRVVEHPVSFIAVKAASTAGTIWLTERLWKRHRVLAVASMVGMNAALALVVRHNASVALR